LCSWLFIRLRLSFLTISLAVSPPLFDAERLIAKVHRIAQQLDIFRLLSYFYSSVGFYLNQVHLSACLPV